VNRVKSFFQTLFLIGAAVWEFGFKGESPFEPPPADYGPLGLIKPGQRVTVGDLGNGYVISVDKAGVPQVSASYYVRLDTGVASEYSGNIVSLVGQGTK
jgi:hypothetical protein